MKIFCIEQPLLTLLEGGLMVSLKLISLVETKAASFNVELMKLDDTAVLFKRSE